MITFKSLSVLIVEDDDNIADLYAEMLSTASSGTTYVFKCSSKKEAFLIAYENEIDVILLDLILGASSWVDTLRDFKKEFPNIPIVVATGHDRPGLAAECFQLGASDFLTKPIDSPALLYRVCYYSAERYKANEIIKKNEAMLRKLTNVAPIGIGMVDRSRTIRWVNPAVCNMLGYTADELLNKNALMLYESEEEYRRVGEVKYEQINQRGVGTVVTRWVRKDKSIIDVELTSVLTSDSLNGYAELVFTALDITNKLEYNRRILNSEARFKSLVEASPLGIYVLKAEGNDLIVKSANRASETYTNITPQELVGLPIEEAFPNIKSTELPEIYRRLILHGGSWETSDFYYEDDRVSGWYDLYAFQISNNEIAVKFQEISPRRQTIKALQVSEEKYRRLVDTVCDGIIIIIDGIIRFVNPSVSEIFGCDKTKVIGESVYEYIQPAYRHVVESLLDVPKDQTVSGFVKLQCDELGYTKDVELRVTRLEWDGQKGTLWSMTDVTERQRLLERQYLLINLLKTLNQHHVGVETIRELLTQIQSYVKVDSIGIRIQEGDDYPYFVCNNFSDDFVLAENYLCQRDDEGHPITDCQNNIVYDCLCGMVITGDTLPNYPFFTGGGSFWTNNVGDFKDTYSDVLDVSFRSRCYNEGFKSMAIIPLMVGDNEIIGTIQLNSFKEGKFDEGIIMFLEELAYSIAVAVKRAWQENRIKELELAKTQDLLRSSRLLNAGIAHELRTPLQAILNCLELILSELDRACHEELCPEANCNCSSCDIRDDIRELLGDGLDRTNYSIDVLNALSKYSKVATKNDTALINVVPQIQTLIRTLVYVEEFKSLGPDCITLVDNSTSDCHVDMDTVDFSQLIENLCRNAADAIDHDNPKIRVEVSNPSERIVRIRVIDNGRGIDPSLGDKIFEPYFSTKSNPDSNNQGLGLAMAKDIVSAYGGDIRYYSRPRYTEFTIEFPCSVISNQGQEDNDGSDIDKQEK